MNISTPPSRVQSTQTEAARTQQGSASVAADSATSSTASATSSTSTGAADASSSGSDANVSLSSLSSQMRSLAASGSADIDTAHVQSIKDAIRNGTLQIDTGKIADGVLETARSLIKPPSGA
ncbi:MAG TPA: flagellar biosynthesis anti-sigma factor FlgM [Paraburkholderia sp.]|nr:flagellar biosynthesis anti-sigma factor FlgM [Paraburkholderia sp.]